MFRRHFLRYRLYYCAHIPGLTNVNAFDEPPLIETEPQNGVERVMNLFQLDKHGEIKKEVMSAVHISAGSAFGLGFYGGIRYSKTAFEDFVDAHQATRYLSAYEFKRKIHDHIGVQFAKYFLIYGFKGFVFTGIFMFSLIIVSAFRDKPGILEYAVGGSLAGALVRINNGLKGMAAGCFTGAFVSTIAGSIIWLLMKGSNISINDVRQWSYDQAVARKELVRGALKKQAEDEHVSRSLEYYTNVITKPANEDDERVFVLHNPEVNSAGSNLSNSTPSASNESNT